MKNNRSSKEEKENKPKGHFDLSEEGSRRGSEQATTAARQAESDDINEELGTGPVNNNNDEWVENKVATSLDDD
jgi:hypothetical protein